MNVAQKEELIIKLNDERRRLFKLIKGGKHPEYEQEYMRRLEEINHELEELIYE